MCAADSNRKWCYCCKTEKSFADFRKNASKSDGLATECRACATAKDKARYAKNVEAEREKRREHYRNNVPSYVARAQQWAARNPEKDKKRRAAYYETHREKILERGREKYVVNLEYNRLRGRKWRQDNPEKSLEHVRARQTRKQKAMPAWADRAEIKAVYAESRRISQETGVKHHVDHIVPLKNPLVCGLHVPANIQIIPALENQAKSNKFVPQETTNGLRSPSIFRALPHLPRG